jgi:hypothetical protein
VEVVGLERDRERDDVEARERTVLLERPQRARPLGARAVGQVGAVDGDARVGREQPVDGLEAQVRHRDGYVFG